MIVSGAGGHYNWAPPTLTHSGIGPMHIILTVTAGPHQGKEFRLAERDSFLVGRSKYAHFALPRDDPYFSRKHFLVEVNPPRCRLLDLKSRNGTWVNGRRVQAAELNDGDEI